MLLCTCGAVVLVMSGTLFAMHSGAQSHLWRANGAVECKCPSRNLRKDEVAGAVWVCLCQGYLGQDPGPFWKPVCFVLLHQLPIEVPTATKDRSLEAPLSPPCKLVCFVCLHHSQLAISEAA
eukprot:1160599-Pelagomonas_calceolata.AAC.10